MINLESPVLFSSAVQSLLQESPGDRVFVEIGPHSTLAAPLKEIFKAHSDGRQPAYIPTLIRNDGDCRFLLLTTLGRLFNCGVALDPARIFHPGKVLSGLPRYPWQHDKRYWHESRACGEWRLRSTPEHELLGSCVPEATSLEPSWRKFLHLDDVPWLAEHVTSGELMFPGTGYVAMAGEAVRQLQPEVSGYSIRNIQFRAALLLDPNRETEILTHLQPVEVADGVLSPWYHFTISAYDGSSWTLHCQGQVRAGHDRPLQRPRPINRLPRSLASKKFYRTVEKAGVEYGPSFRGLESITTDPRRPKAVATITDAQEMHTATATARYILHPSALDQCLQAIALAGSWGYHAPTARALLPLAIENIRVARGGPSVQIAANSQPVASGYYGDIFGIEGGETALMMHGVYLLNAGRPSSKTPPNLVSRMELRPDIDLVSPAELQLLPPPAESSESLSRTKVTNFLADLCIRAIVRWLEGSPDSREVANWKTFCLKRGAVLNQRADPKIAELEQWILSTETDVPYLKATQAKLRTITAAMGEDKNGAHCGSPVWEALSAHELEDFVRKLLEEVSSLMGDHSPLIETLSLAFEYGIEFATGARLPVEVGLADPLLERVLAASMGSATRAVLRDLKTEAGTPLFSRYVFTDASGEGVEAARERFQAEPNVDFKTLDITNDPEEQGFELHSFDLVIVSYTLQAVPSLQSSLGHIRKLLCSQGRLLLHEATEEMAFDVIMGTLTGWWFNDDGNRPSDPFVSPDPWNQELQSARFTGTEVITPEPIGSVSILSGLSSPSSPMGEIAILAADDPCPWVDVESTEFENRGCTVERTILDHPPEQGQFVVCLFEAHSPYLDKITEKEFWTLKRFLVQAEDTQLTCVNPGFGAIHGLARSLRQEMGLDISILEVDKWSEAASAAVVSVCEKVHAARGNLSADQDYEFVLSDGGVLVPRSYRSSFPQELSSIPAPDAPRSLPIGSIGHLETIQWAPLPPSGSLSAGEIEVDVAYAGLNFRDLLVLLGLFGNVDECGIEASGTIRQVGPGVMGPQARRLPDDVSLEDRAAMGVVYMTALHSLVNVANLQKGQSVLIHSAAGGLGIAALNIYATVGKEEKAEFLTEPFQIPRERIFNSRDASFLPDLMDATNGRGVDVVLNSLSGNLLHASWECVAAHGKMIELGKRGLLNTWDPEHESLHLESVLHRINQIFTNMRENGSIKPIRPMNVFDAADAGKAFRYLQTGNYMGRIVLRMPSAESLSTLASTPVRKMPPLSPDRSYLLVGDLGGIGSCVSSWLVHHGARSLVFLSRAAGDLQEHKELIQELQAQGCLVTCVQGTVTNPTDVEKADRTLAHMTFSDWLSALAPKVTGAQHLHEATKDLPLDFFVMFGSISGTVGVGGQANYAAANTYLDAFAQYRRAQGLVASVVNLGLVDEVGVATRRPESDTQFRSHTIVQSESDRASFAVGIGNDKAPLGLLPKPIWGRDARFALHKTRQGPTATGSQGKEEALKDILKQVDQEPSLLNKTELVEDLKTRAAKAIAEQIAGHDDMGEEQYKMLQIDSLTAVEIHTSVRRSMKIDIPTPEIINAGVVGELCGLLVVYLRRKYKLDEQAV
ncbi:polyketide synthase dehydratase-domain-containing protein [Aspergillus lucknowensis]|uniref:Polyketide synthase dehydratase-domain-containing protein n=1 Tax=Aspergillus lucknowensis TaxID=176173 RepID=A0ABR4LFN7_9EURO